nr:phospholipase-like protein [Tanacetum cinerariifolium]
MRIRLPHPNNVNPIAADKTLRVPLEREAKFQNKSNDEVDTFAVNSKFWESLLGIDKERRGWLSNTHLGIWVLYLWHYRLTEADWAIAGPF